MTMRGYFPRHVQPTSVGQLSVPHMARYDYWDGMHVNARLPTNTARFQKRLYLVTTVDSTSHSKPVFSLNVSLKVSKRNFVRISYCGYLGPWCVVAQLCLVCLTCSRGSYKASMCTNMSSIFKIVANCVKSELV